MRVLTKKELENVNGGGPLREVWDDIKYFITEAIPDFCRGFAAGWNS